MASGSISTTPSLVKRMSEAVVPGRVSTQLQAILKRDGDADRIALVWPRPLAEPVVHQEIANTPLRLVYCASELAIREHLVKHEPGGERLVILSPFDAARLANDVLARLWHCEPKRINPWRTLQQLLGIHTIDPRLTRKEYRWVAEVLVSEYERYAGRMTFGNVLDLELAWRALTLALMDFEATEPDLESILTWSLSGDSADRVRELPEPVAHNLGDWLSPRLGKIAPVIQSLWRNDQVASMVGIGLVCELLYGRDRETSQAIYQARGQLTERFFGGAKHDEGALRSYGELCLGFVSTRLKRGERSLLTRTLATAEQILASLDLTAIAIDSDVLDVAFNLRLERLADCLRTASEGKALDAARDAFESLERHQLAWARADQVHRAGLAVRACAWLSMDADIPDSAQVLIRQYVEEGGFVDWARNCVWTGDEQENLNRVYGKLIDKLTDRREALNKAFANHLPKIARGDDLGEGLNYVEHCLDRLIVPLVKQTRVLLLVLDGMSQAVYRELTADLPTNHWVELQRDQGYGPECLLSVLPSTTRLSRYSLLAGKLGEGVSADEKKALSAHGGLKAANAAAVLFHKAELQQPGRGGLSTQVRDTIADSTHKLVAAVVNAVDDQLGSNAQLTVRWTVEQVGVLRQILEAARDAGRVVVMTSDHGHVLDHAMNYRKSAGDTERYKSSAETVQSGEVLVEGSRVLQPASRTVVPWSEKVRYSKEKMGYHGGASLQEVIIPFGVFRSVGEIGELSGWTEVPVQSPSWWTLRRPVTSVSDTPASSYKNPRVRHPTKQRPEKKTRDLFETSAPTSANAWIDDVLSSPMYPEMKSRAGRVLISDDQVRKLLQYLAARGGQAMMASIGQAIGIPGIRLNGFLAAAQRLLNVDGYSVLAVDRSARTVKLNIETLKTQFEL